MVFRFGLLVASKQKIILNKNKNKTMKKLKLMTIVAILTMVVLAGCKKDDTGSSGMTPVKVYLTDAPGNFQQVNVDIIGVEFKMEEAGTVILNVNSGVYNLLDFTNGVDTLIASSDVPSGMLSQVRLILGPNNSVMVDSVVYPLSTPSAQQSGLKLNVHSTLVEGVVYNLLLDFDANQSVVLTGNGDYILKPVIRVVSTATTGSIHGNVATALALPATISAVEGLNTFTSVTDTNGYFLMQGIPAGTYSVTITPQTPYVALTIPNVSVTVGNMTELGAITF